MPCISVKNFTPCSARKFWIVKWQLTNHWDWMNFRVMRGLSFHNVMNSDLLSSSEIYPSMKAVLGVVEGWEARDAVLLRVGIFPLEDSAMVEVKEREAFESFWENESFLSVDGEKKSVLMTKMAKIYRAESPTVIYTWFDANLVVATASFWIYLVQRRVIIDFPKVIIDYWFMNWAKYEVWRADNRLS